MAARSYGQYCGVTAAVELVAERWALLIIRDLLVGPRRYTDLKHGLPKIPTNILSTRLKARCGLVYELTEYGRELEPIVLALGRWGFRSNQHGHQLGGHARRDQTSAVGQPHVTPLVAVWLDDPVHFSTGPDELRHLRHLAGAARAQASP